MKRDAIDNYLNNELVCPWCGYKFSDSWDFDDDNGELECNECEKIFRYQREVTVTYDTDRDCKDNNEEHEFVLRHHSSKYNNDMYECTKCDRLHPYAPKQL